MSLDLDPCVFVRNLFRIKTNEIKIMKGLDVRNMGTLSNKRPLFHVTNICSHVLEQDNC